MINLTTIYYYVDNKDIYNTKLDKIVDGYKQTIEFYTDSQRTRIVLPNEHNIILDYASGSMRYIENEVSYQTTFDYRQTSSGYLIKEITYPTGLQTIIEYAELIVIMKKQFQCQQ